jgi:hypothetical protein
VPSFAAFLASRCVYLNLHFRHRTLLVKAAEPLNRCRAVAGLVTLALGSTAARNVESHLYKRPLAEPDARSRPGQELAMFEPLAFGVGGSWDTRACGHIHAHSLQHLIPLNVGDCSKDI